MGYERAGGLERVLGVIVAGGESRSMAVEVAMVNDQIMPIDQAQVSANDRGWFFGDGVYEVVRCCGGRLFEMERHMERLASSLSKMDMLKGVDLKVVRRRVDTALAQSGLGDAVVYLQITRGQALRAHDYDEGWQGSFYLTVRQGKSDGAATARAITHPDWRWKRCDIKSLNLLANVLAKHAACQAGAAEAILVDKTGTVIEGSSTSVLLVEDRVLQTAPLTANILPSITRALILEWAGQVGLTVREESFTVEEMEHADELIISGTITGVRGVTQVGQTVISDGELGTYTGKFQEMLQQAMWGR